MHEEVIKALENRIEADEKSIDHLNEDSARKATLIAENNERVTMFAERINSFREAVDKLKAS